MGCLLILALIVVYGLLANVVGSSSQSKESELQTPVPPKQDALTVKEHTALLRKLVLKHPLLEDDLAATREQVEQLQLRKAEADAKIAELIVTANERLKWGELRNRVSGEAIVACRSATEDRLKAPDAVEWKGEQSGWDPQKDWYYNVDLEANAMNSFGAKLRTEFSCQARCSDKELANGLRCVALSVQER